MVRIFLKKTYFIILLLIPIFIIHPTNVKGFSFSYPEYHFFIDSPTTIDYDAMFFSIKNNYNFPLNVSCGGEEVEGLNISTQLEWRNIIIPPNNRTLNHYSIIVNETFNVTAPIKVSCSETLKDGNLGAGGTIVNWVTYYSEETASLIDIQIIDQAGRPRISHVEVLFAKDNDTTWTPILEFNDSRWIGYLPNGLYQVTAKDMESSISGQAFAIVTNDTDITVELFLLGFDRFLHKIHDNVIGINATINNFLGDIENVAIYAKLYEDNIEIAQTPPIKIGILEKQIGFEVEVWFPAIEWKNGKKYLITGFIDTGEFNLAKRDLELGKYEAPSNVVQENRNIIYAGIILIGFPTSVFLFRKFFRPKYFPQIICPDCSNKYSAKIKFCGNCGKESGG